MQKKLVACLISCSLALPFMVGCGADATPQKPDTVSAPPITDADLTGSKREQAEKMKESVGDGPEAMQ